MTKSLRDLEVWRQSIRLAALVYRITNTFPAAERYGLARQMNRAAVSVACNIAEGQGRMSPREWRHFLSNARGSLYELETQIEIVRELDMIGHSNEQLRELMRSVSRQLEGLIRYVDQKAKGHLT